MEAITIVSRAKLHKMFEEEEKGIYDLRWLKEIEVEGFLYAVYQDRRSKKQYATRKTRCVHMGFNSNEPGKEEEFLEIMKREGTCKASWGVTGRTMHRILANQLAKKYPQFRYEIGDNYECTAFDDHRMVLMPGFEPEIQI